MRQGEQGYVFNFNEIMHVVLDKIDLMGKSNVIFKRFPYVFDTDFSIS